MKTTPFALFVLVSMSALTSQNAFGQQKPTPTPPAAGAAQQRPELKPGPRSLTQREKEMLRDARKAYVAQAKNDVKTFLHYMADEYFKYDRLTGDLETKETWRNNLTEMAREKDSSIRGDLPDPENPALGKTETLVIAGDTAIQSSEGKVSADGKNWVPVRTTIIWVHRDGRWQRLFDSEVARKDASAK